MDPFNERNFCTCLSEPEIPASALNFATDGMLQSLCKALVGQLLICMFQPVLCEGHHCFAAIGNLRNAADADVSCHLAPLVDKAESRGSMIVIWTRTKPLAPSEAASQAEAQAKLQTAVLAGLC